MLCKGSYHHFSTENVSASGDLAPLPPIKGLHPGPHEGALSSGPSSSICPSQQFTMAPSLGIGQG